MIFIDQKPNFLSFFKIFGVAFSLDFKLADSDILEYIFADSDEEEKSHRKQKMSSDSQDSGKKKIIVFFCH